MGESKAKRKVKIIEISGTSHDIGLQYGSAEAEDIKKALKWWLARLGIGLSMMTSMVKKLVPFTNAYAPDFLDVIKGIAEGARCKLEEIFFLNLTTTMKNVAVGKAMGCTSFAAVGEATKDGETIIGQNYDWIPDLEETIGLLKVRPVEGPSYLGLALYGPGSLAVSGINSAGLGLHGNGIWYADSVSPTYNWVPWSAIHSKILSSTNISKAIGAIASAKRSPPPYSVNIVLASRDGNIVDIESTWNDLGLLYPKREVIAHANHFETDRFKSKNLAVYRTPDSYIRSNRLVTLMAKHHGKLSVDVMKKLLQDHSNYPYSICKHVDETTPGLWQESKTLASVISCPGKQKIYIALGNPCENQYMEYKL